jgi:GT2 family glycosyltransferase
MSARSGPSVTAIVVTHNSAGHVAQCLASLDPGGVRVVVVDNASTDDSLAVVAASAPAAAVVANERNVGFACAVNQGLAHVRTPYVLLLNPDCTVPSSTVDTMAAYLGGHPDASVVGPRLYQADGSLAVSAHAFESLATVVVSRFGGNLVPVRVRGLLSRGRRRASYQACLRDGPPVEVDWVSGACLMTRTAVLRGIGGLDERYFLYYEDEELCLRSWRHGSVVYLPRVSAVHIGGACSPEPGATWHHLYRSMLVFFARYHPTTYQAVRAVVLARAVAGLALAGARWLTGRPSARHRARAWRRVATIALMAHRDVEGRPA